MPAIVADSSEKNAEKKQITKKKTVDKWKKKTWYGVFAPKEFDRKEIGSTVSEKPASLNGRTLQVSARNLSQDIKKSHIMLLFKINEVKGNKAYAQSIGHEIKDSYFRKFVRRRNTKVDVVTIAETKDKTKIKVKAMVLTANKIEKIKQTALRKIMIQKIISMAKNFDAQEFISELVFGNIVQKIYNDAKKIGLVKRVEITKSRIQ